MLIATFIVSEQLRAFDIVGVRSPNQGFILQLSTPISELWLTMYE